MQEDVILKVDSRRRVNLNRWLKCVESCQVKQQEDGSFLLTPNFAKNTPGTCHIFSRCGPTKDMITVIAITPNP
jgi:hypothetical protein